MSKRLVIAVLSLCLPALATNAGTEYRYIRIPAALLSQNFVQSTGFIRDHKRDDTYAFGYLPKTVSVKAGEMVELDAREWATSDHDAKTLQRLPSPRPKSAAYEDFHTYESLTTELKSLASRYPALATLASAGKSVQGRDLWVLRITASQIPDPHKPKLLFVSSMHGDEVTPKEVMVYLIRQLLSGYGTDARLTRLVNYAEIDIMPSMNPDGTELHQRFNANGVDLNRDFPGLDEPVFAEDGRAPETKALMELHRANHFAIALNFHGGALCINIPWDSKPNTLPSDHFGDDALMMALARSYSTANGPMSQVTEDSFDHGVTYGYEWYQVLGGMQDWADFFQQSVHATLEMSDTKWPEASELPGFWKDNQEALLRYLEGGMNGIHLSVTDATGAPVSVHTDISSATRRLTYEDGFVHRPSTTGVQTVTLSADGYATQTLTVNSAAFDGTYQKVVMVKE